MRGAVATAHPNIALVKYWGKRDVALNLPAVPSLSLTLDRFATRTRVDFGAREDEVVLDGKQASEKDYAKVLSFVTKVAPDRPCVRVNSTSNFPVAAGLASSSSAFAALALATAAAAGQPLDKARLSALARQGSGSACRSLWGGFVEWTMGERADGTDSIGVPVAPVDHWDVAMVVGIVSEAKKAVGSTEGMERSRATSAYYAPWLATAAADVEGARAAVLARDLERLGQVMESSTFKMHATMHTSRPPIVYQQPGTLGCLHAVFALRAAGVSAWATMDAGPQVKVLCARADASRVAEALAPHTVRVETLAPGGDPIVEVDP